MEERKTHSEILTVMFIDLVDYTKTTSNLDREKLSELHDMFDGISLSTFKTWKGKVIKKIGDSFLITFKSPTNAVLCGIDLQKNFETFQKETKTKSPVQIKVAIHSGEVIIKKKDVYGDVVNTASRMEGIAKGGEVIFSESVYTTMNKNEILYTYLGAKKMKGLKHPIKLFRVKSEYEEILKRRRKIRRGIKRGIKKTILLVILLMIIAAIIYWGVQVYYTGKIILG